MHGKRLFVATLCFLAAVLLTASASAQPLTFPLSGDQETPPVDTATSGRCDGNLGASAFEVSCTHDATTVVMAHIHKAPRGTPGPIIFFLDPTTGFSASVTQSSIDDQVSDGLIPPMSFSAFKSDLLKGNLYVNIHTPANPTGQLRGQIPGSVLQFPQFGNGEGLTSDIVLINLSSTPSGGEVRFYDPDGNSLTTGVEGEGPTNSLLFFLNGLETQTFSTDGMATNPPEPDQGSAVVFADRPIAGVIRFEIENINVAGVGSGTPFSKGTAPVQREAGGINTGLAVRNVSPDDGVIVTLKLLELGVEVGSATRELDGGGRFAEFINELFPDVDTDDFSGSVVICAEGNGSLAAVALELDVPAGTFTTIPVTPIP